MCGRVYETAHFSDARKCFCELINQKKKKQLNLEHVLPSKCLVFQIQYVTFTETERECKIVKSKLWESNISRILMKNEMQSTNLTTWIRKLDNMAAFNELIVELGLWFSAGTGVLLSRMGGPTAYNESSSAQSKPHYQVMFLNSCSCSSLMKYISMPRDWL